MTDYQVLEGGVAAPAAAPAKSAPAPVATVSSSPSSGADSSCRRQVNSFLIAGICVAVVLAAIFAVRANMKIDKARCTHNVAVT